MSIETLLSRWIVFRKSLHLYGFFHQGGHDFDQLFDSELRVSYLYLCLYLYLYLPAPKSWASFVLFSAALVYLSLGRAYTCKISELASDSFVDWLCTEEDFSFLAKRRALFNWICKQVFFLFHSIPFQWTPFQKSPIVSDTQVVEVRLWKNMAWELWTIMAGARRALKKEAYHSSL